VRGQGNQFVMLACALEVWKGLLYRGSMPYRHYLCPIHPTSSADMLGQCTFAFTRSIRPCIMALR